MRRWTIIILILLAVGSAGLYYVYTYVYNKPHADIEQALPDHRLSASELFNHYTFNREDADGKYTGKVVEISGIMTKAETSGDLTIAVFVMDEGLFGDEGIRCTMLDNHAETIAGSAGREITLKGFCSGYNETDVIMEKCSVIP